MSAEKWKANNTFGLGLNFQSAVNLANSQFNVEIDSSFDFSTNPYVAWSLMHLQRWINNSIHFIQYQYKLKIKNKKTYN